MVIESEVVKCSLCESTSCREVHHSHSSLFECEKCGLYFCWPHISVIPEVDDDLGKNEHWGGDSPYQAYAVWREAENNRVASLIKPFGPFERIFEIGYGTGALTKLLLNSSKEYWGVEPFSEHQLETKQALGLEEERVFCITAEEIMDNSKLAASEGAFDAVVLISVFEHLSEPLKVLEACNFLLRSGGLLFLSTPDSTFFNQLLQIRKLAKLPLWSPDHISFFNANNLEATFTRFGFSVVERKTPNLICNESIEYFYRKSGSRVVQLAMKVFSILRLDRALRISTFFYVLRKI